MGNAVHIPFVLYLDAPEQVLSLRATAAAKGAAGATSAAAAAAAAASEGSAAASGATQPSFQVSLMQFQQVPSVLLLVVARFFFFLLPARVHSIVPRSP
jgi:hypothetical protein